MTTGVAAQTSKSVARNVLYGSLTWILPLFLSLAATPLLIRSLGVDTYGVYVLILGFIGYSFSFGFGRAAVKYIAEYRISGEIEKIRSVFSATMLVSVAAGIVGLVILLLFADQIVSDILRIDPDLQASTAKGIKISGAIILVSGVNQVFWSAIQGTQRFDVYSKLFNTNSFILLSGNIVLAVFGFGLVALIWWNLLSIALMTALSGIAAQKTLPQLGLGLSTDLSALPRVVSYTSGIVGYQILGNALLLIERGWITRAFGSDELAYYVVAMSLGLYIHSFANSLTLIIAPLTSETQNDPDKLLAVYQRATKFLVIIVGFIATALFVGRHLFLTLWVGQDFADKAAGLLSIHLISFSLLAIGVISWQMREGLGLPSHNLIITLFYFVMTLALMYILAARWDTMGVAIARMAGCVFMAATILHFERWLFGKIAVRFWLKILLIVCAAMISAGFVQALLISAMPVSWATLVVSVAAGGLVYLGAMWLLRVISRDEREMILGIFRR